MKFIIAIGIIFITSVLVLPSIIVIGFSNEEVSPYEDPEFVKQTTSETMYSEFTVAVYRNETSVIEQVAFEEYIVGVVSSEMPATFEIEALKAQALTARTYYINLLTFENLDLPKGAYIKDTVEHQVYRNNDELKEIWGDNYNRNIARIREAVYETRGEIITYEGLPISAQYFSTSNGYTENSEDYYEHEFPYLRSVESPWDVESPHYESEHVLSISDFQEALEITLDRNSKIKVLGRTNGGNIKRIRVADKEFTGRELRELLPLKSSDFTINLVDNAVSIQTRGYGHGVGMSQYGANGMAKEGSTYKDIIHHYFQSVKIQHKEEVMGLITETNN
ncbi:stage II sporulation protein D [Evansella vedderi]|uniref:Stage II sporulation protein D n=1 Tax=Evansella vedderi TaxID=38282 RepID=A0ABT9ZUB8_9BACI|nr:stage II sporulation protein D [Evansella vedderi]MDQ0254836.1 stage II sporulation protein D [Evansella vedderi]